MAAADVWIVSIPEDDGGVTLALSMLTPDERARAARFRHDDDRRSYVVSHAALRVLLGRARGSRLEDRPFTAGPHGRPFIPGAAHFNLSRASTRAAIGICPDSAIGVDIERIARGSRAVDVVGTRFSATERAWLDRAATPDARRHRCLRLWVIREALVKAEGGGLTRTLADGEIAIDADAPALSATSGWQLVEPTDAAAQCLDGYIAAAVVVRGVSVNWRCVGFTELAAGISSLSTRD